MVIIWGGIDAFKEERPTEPYLRAGMATLCIDMPGVADAPLAGSEDGERLWDAVLDWMVNVRIWIRTVSALSGAAPEDTGQQSCA